MSHIVSIATRVKDAAAVDRHLMPVDPAQVTRTKKVVENESGHFCPRTLGHALPVMPVS